MASWERHWRILCAQSLYEWQSGAPGGMGADSRLTAHSYCLCFCFQASVTRDGLAAGEIQGREGRGGLKPPTRGSGQYTRPAGQ